MMRKALLLLALVFTSNLFIHLSAQAPSTTAKSGEDIGEHLDACLEIMEEAAQRMSVQGVAVVAFIPGNVSKSWISKMKVVGNISNGEANYLAIAYSKAAEMADTYKNSGANIRKPMHGEFAYQGGLIKKTASGYLLAVFSGATGEQDTAIANEGLENLSKHYKFLPE